MSSHHHTGHGHNRPELVKPVAQVEVEHHEGHCMKCGAQRDIVNGEHTTAKNGRPMFKGKCAQCGTTIAVFLKGATVKPAAPSKPEIA